MRTLIVATNATPATVFKEISAGSHNRIDYLLLSNRLGADYRDYGIVRKSRLSAGLENWLRMDYREAWQINRLARAGGYEQVFSMSERVAIPLALMLPRHVRHVVQLAHGLSPYKFRFIRLTGIYRRWNTIIAPTKAEKDVLGAQLKLGPDRLRFLPYPVDTQFFSPGAGQPWDNEPAHIESLGLSYRDFPTLIETMRGLPHIPCYLRAGSTWVSHSAGFRRDNLPANIQIKEFIPPSRLRGAYGTSRVIVVPIRLTTQWSAGCTVISQAQAMGRPVIASRTPGLSDYIDDNQSGLLVEQGSPAALAAAIQALWQDPQRAEEMGRCGRQWAEKQYSLDKWVEDMAALLSEQ